MNALLKYHSERIIVKESMCNPCHRTVVTHVSGLYKKGEGLLNDSANQAYTSHGLVLSLLAFAEGEDGGEGVHYLRYAHTYHRKTIILEAASKVLPLDDYTI